MISSSWAKSFAAWFYHCVYPRALLDDIIELSQESWCLILSVRLFKGFAWWYHRVFGSYHETLASTHTLGPWAQGVHCWPGADAVPCFRDDMSHDALMWGRGGTCRWLRPWAWARAFPLGPTAMHKGKIGEAEQVFCALEHYFIFFMFFFWKFFPDFICADVTCPDVPNVLCFHDSMKV